METELGDPMAEGIREQLGVDLVLLGSVGICKPELGPIVTLMDYMTVSAAHNRSRLRRFGKRLLCHAGQLRSLHTLAVDRRPVVCH